MIDQYKSIKGKWNGDIRPVHGEYVLGFDEEDQQEVRVRYCSSSNRFFTEFHSSVYPLDRMYKWKAINLKGKEVVN
jgi:hypothetical protein